MRHPAGQLSDRLQPLCLPQGGFRLLPLADLGRQLPVGGLQLGRAFGNPALEHHLGLPNLRDPLPRLVLSPTPPQGRMNGADQGGRVKRAFQKANIAQGDRQAAGDRVSLHAAAAP